MRASLRSAVLAVALLSVSARADTPASTEFREAVYFSVYGGGGVVSASSVTDVAGISGAPMIRAGSWQFGLANGVRFSDWLQWDWLAIDALDLSLGTPTCTACTRPIGLGGLRLSSIAKVSLPLRYVGPYVGVGPGLYFLEASSGLNDQRLSGTPGLKFGLRTVAGMNLYFDRYLTWFVQAEVIGMDVSSNLRRTNPNAGGTQSIQGLLDVNFVIGADFNPEMYRRGAQSELIFLGTAGLPALIGIVMAIALPARAAQ